jgi:phosphotransacetylase
MEALNRIRNLAKRRVMTIVLPEYDDKRTIEAERIVLEEKIAKPLVLTPEMIDRNLLDKYIGNIKKM